MIDSQKSVRAQSGSVPCPSALPSRGEGYWERAIRGFHRGTTALRRRPRSAFRPLLLLTTALLALSGTSLAEKLPPLWGYGIKGCDAYLRAAAGQSSGDELQVLEYRRYEDWLTGLVSGLNLATGKDVLVGAELDVAMQRIRAYCEGHKTEDFFTATMDLVRMLSGLR